MRVLALQPQTPRCACGQHKLPSTHGRASPSSLPLLPTRHETQQTPPTGLIHIHKAVAPHIYTYTYTYTQLRVNRAGGYRWTTSSGPGPRGLHRYPQKPPGLGLAHGSGAHRNNMTNSRSVITDTRAVGDRTPPTSPTDLKTVR